MGINQQVRRVVDRALDEINAVGQRSAVLDRWQRARFFSQAHRFVEALEVETQSGARYLVRPSDQDVGMNIVRFGGFEIEKVEAVLGLLGQHGVELRQLVDIGANIGTNVVEILRRRPQATAVAFEPDATNFRYLAANVAANGLDSRVVLHRAAVSRRSGTVELALSPNNPGDHRVSVPADVDGGMFGEAGRTLCEVPSHRLDDVFNPGDLGTDTLVYMDVQGHEGEVLAGGTSALAHRPPLAMEFWPYGLDRAAGRADVVDVLNGYSHVYDVGDDPPRRLAGHDLESLAARLAVGQGFTDLVAINP